MAQERASGETRILERIGTELPVAGPHAASDARASAAAERAAAAPASGLHPGHETHAPWVWVNGDRPRSRNLELFRVASAGYLSVTFLVVIFLLSGVDVQLQLV